MNTNILEKFSKSEPFLYKSVPVILGTLNDQNWNELDIQGQRQLMSNSIKEAIPNYIDYVARTIESNGLSQWDNIVNRRINEKCKNLIYAKDKRHLEEQIAKANWEIAIPQENNFMSPDEGYLAFVTNNLIGRLDVISVLDTDIQNPIKFIQVKNNKNGKIGFSAEIEANEGTLIDLASIIIRKSSDDDFWKIFDIRAGIFAEPDFLEHGPFMKDFVAPIAYAEDIGIKHLRIKGFEYESQTII